MSITVTIKGDGLSLEKQTTLQKAGQIITFLGLEEGDTLVNGQASSTPKVLTSSSGKSPKEAIGEANAKTNAQKITVIGKYLSDNDGSGEFLTKEVLLQLRKIGDEPGNFKRDLSTAETLKYIYPIPSKKGSYGITDRGKQAILDKFAEEIQIKTTTKGKGVFKKAVPLRNSVVSLSIVTDMEGYPSFHSLPTKADSILWVLAYADKNAIQELTPREVEFITDKLKNKIAQSGFSAHNKRNVKLSLVSLTNGTFKLQQKGIDHLKKLSNPKRNDKKEE